MANKQTIIGKTAPVPLGQQKAVNSLPVVFAEDQPPIPVEEQNKIQSEVALSLLGIPRAEVALGIFADVNTYDVNPSEWSQFPLENEPDTGTGVNHVATEAGAELVAAEGGNLHREQCFGYARPSFYLRTKELATDPKCCTPYTTLYTLGQ